MSFHDALHDSMHLTLPHYLANEENTFSINDLWVSAAIAQDTAVFDEDDEDTEDYIEEDDEQGDDGRAYTDSISRGTSSAPLGHRPLRMFRTMSAERSPLLESPSVPPKVRLAGIEGSFSPAPTAAGHRTFSMGRVSGSHASRRFSTASHSGMPAIFANTGLNTPPAIAAAYEQEPLYSTASSPGGAGLSVPPVTEHTLLSPGGLSAIEERERPASVTASGFSEAPASKQDEKAPPAGWRALPMLIILQVIPSNCCPTLIQADVAFF